MHSSPRSEKNGRYTVSVLRPTWWVFWHGVRDFYWPFQVLIPTEELPSSPRRPSQAAASS